MVIHGENLFEPFFACALLRFHVEAYYAEKPRKQMKLKSIKVHFEICRLQAGFDSNMECGGESVIIMQPIELC